MFKKTDKNQLIKRLKLNLQKIGMFRKKFIKNIFKVFNKRNNDSKNKMRNDYFCILFDDFF